MRNSCTKCFCNFRWDTTHSCVRTRPPARTHARAHTHTCALCSESLLPTFPGRDGWCELWGGNTKTISSHMLLFQLLFQLDILTLRPLILEIMRWWRRVSCVRTVQERLLSRLNQRTVPWLNGSGRQSPVSHHKGMDSIPGQYMGFRADKVAKGQVPLPHKFFDFPINIIPPVLHTCSSPITEVILFNLSNQEHC